MRLLIVIVPLVAVAVGAQAGHCTTWSNAQPEIDTNPLGAPAPRYYADIDCAPIPFLFHCISPPLSAWIYEESNGLPGLQREDDMIDSTCHRMIAGDTIVL